MRHPSRVLDADPTNLYYLPLTGTGEPCPIQKAMVVRCYRFVKEESAGTVEVPCDEDKWDKHALAWNDGRFIGTARDQLGGAGTMSCSLGLGRFERVAEHDLGERGQRSEPIANPSPVAVAVKEEPASPLQRLVNETLDRLDEELPSDPEAIDAMNHLTKREQQEMHRALTSYIPKLLHDILLELKAMNKR